MNFWIKLIVICGVLCACSDIQNPFESSDNQEPQRAQEEQDAISTQTSSEEHSFRVIANDDALPESFLSRDDDERLVISNKTISPSSPATPYIHENGILVTDNPPNGDAGSVIVEPGGKLVLKSASSVEFEQGVEVQYGAELDIEILPGAGLIVDTQLLSCDASDEILFEQNGIQLCLNMCFEQNDSEVCLSSAPNNPKWLLDPQWSGLYQGRILMDESVLNIQVDTRHPQQIVFHADVTTDSTKNLGISIDNISQWLQSDRLLQEVPVSIRSVFRSAQLQKLHLRFSNDLQHLLSVQSQVYFESSSELPIPSWIQLSDVHVSFHVRDPLGQQAKLHSFNIQGTLNVNGRTFELNLPLPLDLGAFPELTFSELFSLGDLPKLFLDLSKLSTPWPGMANVQLPDFTKFVFPDGLDLPDLEGLGFQKVQFYFNADSTFSGFAFDLDLDLDSLADVGLSLPSPKVIDLENVSLHLEVRNGALTHAVIEGVAVLGANDPKLRVPAQLTIPSYDKDVWTLVLDPHHEALLTLGEVRNTLGIHTLPVPSSLADIVDSLLLETSIFALDSQQSWKVVQWDVNVQTQDVLQINDWLNLEHPQVAIQLANPFSDALKVTDLQFQGNVDVSSPGISSLDFSLNVAWPFNIDGFHPQIQFLHKPPFLELPELPLKLQELSSKWPLPQIPSLQIPAITNLGLDGASLGQLNVGSLDLNFDPQDVNLGLNGFDFSGIALSLELPASFKLPFFELLTPSGIALKDWLGVHDLELKPVFKKNDGSLELTSLQVQGKARIGRQSADVHQKTIIPFIVSLPLDTGKQATLTLAPHSTLSLQQLTNWLDIELLEQVPSLESELQYANVSNIMFKMNLPEIGSSVQIDSVSWNSAYQQKWGLLDDRIQLQNPQLFMSVNDPLGNATLSELDIRAAITLDGLDPIEVRAPVLDFNLNMPGLQLGFEAGIQIGKVNGLLTSLIPVILPSANLDAFNANIPSLSWLSTLEIQEVGLSLNPGFSGLQILQINGNWFDLNQLFNDLFERVGLSNPFVLRDVEFDLSWNTGSSSSYVEGWVSGNMCIRSSNINCSRDLDFIPFLIEVNADQVNVFPYYGQNLSSLQLKSLMTSGAYQSIEDIGLTASVQHLHLQFSSDMKHLEAISGEVQVDWNWFVNTPSFTGDLDAIDDIREALGLQNWHASFHVQNPLEDSQLNVARDLSIEVSAQMLLDNELKTFELIAPTTTVPQWKLRSLDTLKTTHLQSLLSRSIQTMNGDLKIQLEDLMENIPWGMFQGEFRRTELALGSNFKVQKVSIENEFSVNLDALNVDVAIEGVSLVFQENPQVEFNTVIRLPESMNPVLPVLQDRLFLSEQRVHLKVNSENLIINSRQWPLTLKPQQGLCYVHESTLENVGVPACTLSAEKRAELTGNALWFQFKEDSDIGEFFMQAPQLTYSAEEGVSVIGQIHDLKSISIDLPITFLESFLVGTPFEFVLEALKGLDLPSITQPTLTDWSGKIRGVLRPVLDLPDYESRLPKPLLDALEVTLPSSYNYSVSFHGPDGVALNLSLPDGVKLQLPVIQGDSLLVSQVSDMSFHSVKGFLLHQLSADFYYYHLSSLAALAALPENALLETQKSELVLRIRDLLTVTTPAGTMVPIATGDASSESIVPSELSYYGYDQSQFKAQLDFPLKMSNIPGVISKLSQFVMSPNYFLTGADLQGALHERLKILLKGELHPLLGGSDLTFVDFEKSSQDTDYPKKTASLLNALKRQSLVEAVQVLDLVEDRTLSVSTLPVPIPGLGQTKVKLLAGNELQNTSLSELLCPPSSGGESCLGQSIAIEIDMSTDFADATIAVGPQDGNFFKQGAIQLVSSLSVDQQLSSIIGVSLDALSSVDPHSQQNPVQLKGRYGLEVLGDKMFTGTAAFAENMIELRADFESISRLPLKIQGTMSGAITQDHVRIGSLDNEGLPESIAVHAQAANVSLVSPKLYLDEQSFQLGNELLGQNVAFKAVAPNTIETHFQLEVPLPSVEFMGFTLGGGNIPAVKVSVALSESNTHVSIDPQNMTIPLPVCSDSVTLPSITLGIQQLMSMDPQGLGTVLFQQVSQSLLNKLTKCLSDPKNLLDGGLKEIAKNVANGSKQAKEALEEGVRSIPDALGEAVNAAQGVINNASQIVRDLYDNISGQCYATGAPGQCIPHDANADSISWNNNVGTFSYNGYAVKSIVSKDKSLIKVPKDCDIWDPEDCFREIWECDSGYSESKPSKQIVACTKKVNVTDTTAPEIHLADVEIPKETHGHLNLYEWSSANRMKYRFPLNHEQSHHLKMQVYDPGVDTGVTSVTAVFQAQDASGDVLKEMVLTPQENITYPFHGLKAFSFVIPANAWNAEENMVKGVLKITAKNTASLSRTLEVLFDQVNTFSSVIQNPNQVPFEWTHKSSWQGDDHIFLVGPSSLTTKNMRDALSLEFTLSEATELLFGVKSQNALSEFQLVHQGTQEVIQYQSYMSGPHWNLESVFLAPGRYQASWRMAESAPDGQIWVDAIEFSTKDVVQQVSAGTSQTCAVMVDQTLRCWGLRPSGKRPDGSLIYTISAKPELIKGLSGVTQVSVGGFHTCVVLDTGNAKCWGFNDFGQLGNGSTQNEWEPVYVQTSATDTQPLAGIQSISAGSRYTCAVLQNGHLKCWGRNHYGQLGNGNNFTGSPQYDEYEKTPVDVHTSKNNSTPVGLITSISSGREHTCATRSDNKTICWGHSYDGQLGSKDDPLYEAQSTPVLSTSSWVHTSPEWPDTNWPPSNATVPQVVVGEYHTCQLQYISSDPGSVECWGRSWVGQVGDGGNDINKLTPTGSYVRRKDTSLSLMGVTQLSAGQNHTCALMAEGSIYCWGQGWHGELGNGAKADQSLAVPVTGILNAVQLSSGSEHNCVLLDTGEVKCWGSNTGKQLGNGGDPYQDTPRLVEF